jgi:hypothetical protein
MVSYRKTYRRARGRGRGRTQRRGRGQRGGYSIIPAPNRLLP